MKSYRFMSKQAAIGGPALGHDHGNKGLEIQNLASDFGNCVFQISPCISIFSYKKTFTNRSLARSLVEVLQLIAINH